MLQVKNPFFLREISLKDPFCDREEELKELCNHARSCANVVLFSPRRFGKTSLVKRVQAHLALEGAVCVYCQFYGIVSEEDVATRLAKAIFAVTQSKESLFRKVIRFFTSFRPVMTMEPDGQKGMLWSLQLSKANISGYELLEEVLKSLDTFIEQAGVPVHIVFDEFQEITDLPKPLKIEGLLREHIQKQKAAYVFVGSRRSVLLSMFNERKRPFYASAINYPLESLPEEDFVSFIMQEFARGGKKCEERAARTIVSLIECYPYYGQKLAYFVFDCTQKIAQDTEVETGYDLLLKEETPVFEGIFMGLSTSQIALLTALSKEPTHSVYALDFLARHRLGSIGGVQAAIKKLTRLDLIERHAAQGWKVVDPVFARWIRENQ
jgi:hypothetical protein